MANYLENYGLDFLSEDEDVYMAFLGMIVQDGKGLPGYYGTPYFFSPMGDVEFWIQTKRNDYGDYSFCGTDVHCGGQCVWEVVHSGIELTPKDSSKLTRTIMVEQKDGRGGILPVDIITADVLPSYVKGDVFKMQIVAQPLLINYYGNEEEYAEAQPEDENGQKWLVAEGSLAAMQFLYNHDPDRYEQGKDYESDRYIHFQAKVKKLYHGSFEMNGHKEYTFIRCIAETVYGDLEFDHAYEQVPEELRKNIKVGSIISGICILSGDVAIYEYENGAIKDFDHDLRLLRHTFSNGEADRLRSVLTESAIYETETTGNAYIGPDSIVKRLNYVHENSEAKYYAHLATITEAENKEFGVGTRCIVLASGEEKHYESIAFVSVNDNGMIDRIKVSTDSNYRFKIDTPETAFMPFDDVELPTSVIVPIVLRAKLHGLIDDTLEIEDITNDIPDYRSLEDNAQRMLDALQETPQPDVEIALENVFGYLFAKSMEQEINKHTEHPEHKTRLIASYCPADALAGVIASTLSKAAHARLIKAMNLGKSFYNDFKSYIKCKDPSEDAFIPLFKEAAVIVQKIGQMAADSFINNKGGA